MNAIVKRANEERGSLALEQILFIGAVIAMSAGMFVFYDNITAYFAGINFAPLNVPINNP